MKSIPPPTERYSNSRIYPKKLSPSTSPTKVKLPSLTIEVAGVARVDHHASGPSSDSPESTQRQFWRDQADMILTKGGRSKVRG